MLGRLWRDRYPINATWELLGPIGFDCQLIAGLAEHFDKIIVYLKRGLTTRKDDPIGRQGKPPASSDDFLSFHLATRDELCVAVKTFGLTAALKVTPTESYKEVGRAEPYSFALDAIEDLVDGVCLHSEYSAQVDGVSLTRTIITSDQMALDL